MSEPPVQDARAMLRDVAREADDEQLTELAENLGGVQGFLEMVFEGMKGAVDPTKAQDAVVGWQIVHGDDVHPYRIEIKGGTVTWERTEPSDARVTLRMKLPVFVRLIAGELDGMAAFMSGALQLTGDMIFATQIQDMFASA